jgi:DNA-binding GntR family transcriptional regulator
MAPGPSDAGSWAVEADRLAKYEGAFLKADRNQDGFVEAIEARDGEMAELLMRRHISSARKNIETQYAAHKAENLKSDT